VYIPPHACRRNPEIGERGGGRIRHSGKNPQRRKESAEKGRRKSGLPIPISRYDYRLKKASQNLRKGNSLEERALVSFCYRERLNLTTRGEEKTKRNPRGARLGRERKKEGPSGGEPQRKFLLREKKECLRRAYTGSRVLSALSPSTARCIFLSLFQRDIGRRGPSASRKKEAPPRPGKKESLFTPKIERSSPSSARKRKEPFMRQRGWKNPPIKKENEPRSAKKRSRARGKNRCGRARATLPPCRKKSSRSSREQRRATNGEKSPRTLRRSRPNSFPFASKKSPSERKPEKERLRVEVVEGCAPQASGRRRKEKDRVENSASRQIRGSGVQKEGGCYTDPSTKFLSRAERGHISIIL